MQYVVLDLADDAALEALRGATAGTAVELIVRGGTCVHLMPTELSPTISISHRKLDAQAHDQFVSGTFHLGHLVYNHGGYEADWRVYGLKDPTSQQATPAIVVCYLTADRPVAMLFRGVPGGDLTQLNASVLSYLRPPAQAPAELLSGRV